MSDNRATLQLSLSVIIATLITTTYQSISIHVDSVWMDLLPHDWVIVVVFFWVSVRPHMLSFSLFWGIGFLLDVLYNHPLGLNGICLAAIIYAGQQVYDVYIAESERQMLILLFVVLFVVTFVKTSLLSVLLELEFSARQMLSIFVTLVFALLAIRFRKWAQS